MIELGCLILLLVLCPVQGQVLQGLHFQDGRKERVIWEHDDFPSYELDPNMDVPTQFSFCIRFFMEYANQKSVRGESQGILQLWTHERLSNDGASVEFNILANYPYFYVDGSDKIKDFRRQTSNPYREHLLRKWNSVCYSLDFGKANENCQMLQKKQDLSRKCSAWKDLKFSVSTRGVGLGENEF